MKKLILSIMTLVFILSTAVTQAAPLKLPSRSYILKEIKKIDSGGLGIAGLRDYKNCDKVSIRTAKILRVGRAVTSYYKRSGDYAGSHFMVKLKATGTCTFKKFHDFFADLDGDGYDDKIAGTLPIINEPLEVSFGADSYGDWKAGSLSFAGKSLETKRIKQHIKNIFIKGKAAMGNRYASRVIINNIPTGKGDGVYRNGFALSNKGYSSNLHFVSDTNVLREFGAKYRAADWFDLIGYSQNKGSVATLFKNLGIGAKEGVLIKHRGGRFGDRAAVFCSTFDKGKYFISRQSEKLEGEPICMVYTYDRYKNKFLAVKKSVYGKETNTMIERHSTRARKQTQSPTRAKNATGMTSSNKRQKLKAINEMQAFLSTHPKINKALNTLPKASLETLFIRLSEIPNKERRNKEFYHEYSRLKHKQQASNRSPQKRIAGNRSQKHSHGGRYHTHKLPSQGVAHRHRNGPVGR